jgi:hypothetical protein
LSPSWDLFLIVFFIVGIAYGMMLQRERAVVTTVAIYVALVMVGILTEPISGFFAGENTINSFFVDSQVSPFYIQAGVFIGVIILIQTKSGLSGGREGGGLLSPFEVFSYSFLNTALITTSLISFLPEETRIAMIESSKMAGYLANHHTWWLILPVAALIVFGWNRNPFMRG